MASRQIVDPLLRISPLITSTCSLWYALDQHYFLHIFTKPENQAASRPLLSRYFSKIFYSGTAWVLSLIMLTLSSSIVNLRQESSLLHARQSFRWYAAGAIFTVCHLLFVPFIAPSCKVLVEDTSGDRSIESLQDWLSIHRIRTWTVDLAAWVTFAVAVTRTLGD